MKKKIALILTGAISLSATACTGSTPIGSASAQLASQAQEILEGGISGEISVSCYDTMAYKSYLEEAAAAFEEKYPGTKVNVSTFSKMPEVKTSESDGKKLSVMILQDDPQDKEDYISKINTELMSGAGADVLAMDVLPYYKYAESGQLEDLNQYMAADNGFQAGDYQENILKAAQYKGGQYIFPIDYSFEYLAYDSSLFSLEEQKALLEADAFTFEELIEIGKAPFEAANSGKPEMPVKMFGSIPQILYNQLLQANYHHFIDIESKIVNLNNGDFAALLNSTKEYAERGYIKSGDMNNGKMGGEKIGNEKMAMEAFEKNNAEQFLFKNKSSMGLMSVFNKNMKLRIATYGSTTTGNEENDEIAGLVTNAEGKKVYTYSQAYGLNANSKNKTTAWEFIKFLAGEELQTSFNLRGFPINNTARAERAKQEITGKHFEPERNDGLDELDQEQTEIFEAYRKAVEGFSNQMNTLLIKDATIQGFLNDELKYFFDGSKTAEEAAVLLQNKIELYLNE